jgi:signal transduction histidine kinase
MVRKLLSYSSERKQSDEEKTEVLIGISHDLKTPLAVIKTGIQNMIDGIGGAINNAHTEIAHICLNAVDKTLIFINDLLDLSRIRFTKLNVRREYFNFAETVANEVNNVSDLARKNNQVLNLDIINKESGLWGDKEKLARVVMNLLSNALKYTPSGGSIKVVLTCDEDTARLSVINTGPGIPADKIERIFNKYERLKTTSMVEGSGLGLYIVKDIIDLHKGRIAVQSQPDKETQFDIILPRDLRGARRRSS